MSKYLVIVLALMGGPLWGCPAAPDHSDALTDLLAQVQGARTQAEADGINAQMWALWAKAPDDIAQEILNNGMRKRESFDFLGALKEYDRLVAYCPSYAEGYNQRAFVNFLRQEYALALADLDRALALSPTHVAALSGKALTLLGMGQIDEGQAVLKEALKLNPWLHERHLLIPQKGEEL